MAIKTKKISDLSTISTSESVILGMNGTTTGKIPYSSIMSDVDTKINAALNEFVSSQAETEVVATIAEPAVSCEDFTIMGNKLEIAREKIESLSKELKESNSKFTNFYNRYTTTIKDIRTSVDSFAANSSAPSVTCDCSEKIAALEAKVAALEGFVQALQKDGYLTLAEIRKAATEACPICNHTHEEEQTSAE